MAIKIALTNQKGGVAKTTTAVCLADALKHCDYRVLLIDMDAQCNSTDTYGAKVEGENTIVDVLKKDCTAKEAVQHLPIGDIIAGDTLLSQEEYFFYNKNSRELLLSKAIKPIDEDYDFIIIDTPPNLGIYMVNSLCAADGCIIPIHADKYALQGLSLLIDTLNSLKEDINENLKIYGVLLTDFDIRNSIDREFKNQMDTLSETQGIRAFERVIRTDLSIVKVQSMQNETDDNGNITVPNRSLFENYPNSHASEDYAGLVKELIEEVLNNG